MDQITDKKPKVKDEDKEDAPPKDLAFLARMMDTRCHSPTLPLPECKDSLFVTKPFENYEPIVKADTDLHLDFLPNPDVMVKKKFPSEPSTHAI